MMEYEPVIGLEVHIQLLTKSKIFCTCSTQFGAEPNTQVCPVCLGLPGVLPVLNRKVVEYAVRLGLATDSKINHRSIFARKNYFYPDLPKGYQISQFEEPICEFGKLQIELENGESRSITIRRIHMEEDAGKSVHAEAYVSADETLVDINRCGVPLLEIVSEPEIQTPQEAYAYLQRLRQIVRYLGICDGNMEEGSLRCDANISMRPKGTNTLGVKTEVKNMNSFHAVEKALEFEIKRQTGILKNGGHVDQVTLLWDPDRNVAEPMRSKEFSHDYRYFPEPDLVPVVVEQEWIDEIASSLPELPMAKKTRFMERYRLPAYDAAILTEDLALADYFEEVAARVNDKKEASNWIMGEVLRAIKEDHIEINTLKVTPEHLASIISMIEKNTINRNIAKTVFEQVRKSGKEPEKIVEEKGLKQISDSSAIESVLDRVLQENPNEVQSYLNGKEKVIGYLVGQAMRATAGKANPRTVNELLRKKMNEMKNS